jgi:predicted phosphoadenosine phosphosulfate sulfurtransferase
MNQTNIRKAKWFWPWQDEQEEAWLEQMSRQGLHLKQAHIAAFYDFVQGSSQNYTYRLDFQDSLKPKNKDEYLRLFTDAGWEHLGQMGGWQ